MAFTFMIGVPELVFENRNAWKHNGDREIIHAVACIKPERELGTEDISLPGHLRSNDYNMSINFIEEVAIQNDLHAMFFNNATGLLKEHMKVMDSENPGPRKITVEEYKALENAYTKFLLKNESSDEAMNSDTYKALSWFWFWTKRSFDNHGEAFIQYT